MSRIIFILKDGSRVKFPDLTGFKDPIVEVSILKDIAHTSMFVDFRIVGFEIIEVKENAA